MNLLQTLNSPSCLSLFDFDLTLYDFSEISVLFSMHEPMNLFIQNQFEMSSLEANHTRQYLWKSYGTTLAGLRIEFDVNPDDFFDYIHHHENIRHPAPNPALNQLLTSLQSEKWIFTNGRRDWAELGTTKIGIRDHFDKIIDLSDSNWVGKPHRSAYAMVQGQVPPDKTVVFLDDSYDNLVMAKNFGWITVWLRPSERGEGPFDYHLESLMDIAY